MLVQKIIIERSEAKEEILLVRQKIVLNKKEMMSPMKPIKMRDLVVVTRDVS